MNSINSPRHFNIPVFIPELACPFQCVFCNQQKISGTEKAPAPEEARSIIEARLATIPPDSETEIAFFGGNFTGIPQDEQERYLSIANEYVKDGRVKSIRLSTRPDYITRESVEFLKSMNVGAIELGAQSLHNEVLRRTGRGHTAEDVEAASKIILSYGLSLGLQMMIGLPLDTRERSIYTARKIIEYGADNTRVYPALVIAGTALERLYHKGTYKPITLEEAVGTAKEVLKIFEAAGVKVLRTGLHPSEELLSGSSLVAGPFHQSFKELALSEIWSDILFDAIQDRAGEAVYIRAPKREINYAVGYGSSNKKKLLERFKKVVFTADEALTGRQVVIDYN
jgi:histone acetyltransferase (RNA polymerase elongator complex component)